MTAVVLLAGDNSVKKKKKAARMIFLLLSLIFQGSVESPVSYPTCEVPGCVNGSVMPTSSLPNVLICSSSFAKISSNSRLVV